MASASSDLAECTALNCMNGSGRAAQFRSDLGERESRKGAVFWACFRASAVSSWLLLTESLIVCSLSCCRAEYSPICSMYSARNAAKSNTNRQRCVSARRRDKENNGHSARKAAASEPAVPVPLLRAGSGWPNHIRWMHTHKHDSDPLPSPRRISPYPERIRGRRNDGSEIAACGAHPASLQDSSCRCRRASSAAVRL